MAEENRVKVDGAVQKTKTLWPRKLKKTTFTAPTPGLESVYLKFGSDQYAAGL